MSRTAAADPRAPATALPRATEPSFGRQLWSFLASLRLLLVVLAVGAVPLIVGTFFIQKPLGGFDAEKEIARIGPQLYALFEALGFYNIYHSVYFRGILLLLSLNNICCTIDRFFVKMKRLTSKAVGVIIVHIGVNVVLAGAYYGSQAGVEGFMQVFENTPKPEQHMFNFATREEIHLPFGVVLDDFRLQMYDQPDERLFLVDPRTRETRHVVTLDRTRPFPQTHALGRQDYVSRALRFLRGGASDALHLEAYYPDAMVRPVVRATGDPSDTWVMQLQTSTPAELATGYLAADASPVTVVPGQLRVGYHHARTPELFAHLLSPVHDAVTDEPTLIVRNAHTGVEASYPARVGEVVHLDDVGATIRLLAYVPDFGAKGERGGATGATPKNPALRVELQHGGVVRSGWLLAKFAGASAVRSDGIALRFRQGLEAGRTPHEVDFVAGPAGERKLVHRHRGRVVDVADANLKTIFALDELQTQLQVLAYTDGAAFDTEVVNLSDEPHNPAVRATLVQGGKPVLSEWLFAGQPVDAPNGAGRLVYDRNFAIREFQSDLSIFKNGVKVVDKYEIIVNRYLAVDGYHIYQASYDEKGGRWSGLSIKRDPGIPIVYAGFVLMFVGILFLFYVRPMLEARRKGRPLIAEAGLDGTC